MDHRASDAPIRRDGPKGPDAAAFWWWQYVWLSLLGLAGYLLEALLQCLPPLLSVFLTGGRASKVSETIPASSFACVNSPLGPPFA